MGNPDLIILPGTKTTVLDLNHIRGCGLGTAVVRRAAAGTPVIGICGGYQMLGKTINDPLHVESAEVAVEGLGLLDIETTFESVKTTTQVRATVLAVGRPARRAHGDGDLRLRDSHGANDTAWRGARVFRVVATPDGPASYFDGTVRGDGTIFGSYIHGLFHNTAFTHGLLDFLRQRRGVPVTAAPDIDRDEQYDALATVVRQSLDMNAVYRIVSGGDKGMR